MFSVTFALPSWLIAFGCLVVIALGVWSYRHTVPPVTSSLRIVLTVLRITALLGGLAILGRPVINLIKEVEHKAELIILVDRSVSMELTGAEGTRIDEVKAILTGSGFIKLDESFDLHIFDFADSLGQLWETGSELVENKPQGVGTNLSRSWLEGIDRVGTDATAAMIMITDGVNNSGPDPARIARQSKVPIWTVGVGSADAEPDVMVKSILTSPTVYKDSNVPIEVAYRAIEADGEMIRISVKDTRGAVLESKSVRINGALQENHVEFNIPVRKIGIHRYSVEINTLKNEVIVGNNKRSFYLNVLDSHMQILIITGTPDNNLGDLIRRMSDDEHIDLQVLTQKGHSFYEGGWPTDSSLNNLDAILLHHFPARGVDKNELRKLVDLIISNEIPICFFDGGAIQYNLLRSFESIFPVVIKQNIRKHRTGKLIPVKRHAVIADPEVDDFRAGWLKLPPLMFAAGRFATKPDARVLVALESEDAPRKYPAIVIRESGSVKSAAVLAQDIWRLGLSGDENDAFLDEFYGRMVRWLVIRRTIRNVTLQLDKSLYSNREIVNYTVTVQNESLMPVDDAQVSTRLVTGGDTIRSSVLEGIGGGRYRGSFHTWGDGEYELAVEAFLGEQMIGVDQQRFTVEPFSIELLDLRLNEELLRDVAEFSGGKYVTSLKADSLFSTFNYKPVSLTVESRLELWGRGWMLWIILSALTIEWFIRMRTGML